jgi:hypothetical protein
MPIVTVELVGDEQHAGASLLSQSLADEIARAMHSSAGQTWVRVRWLRRCDYAENESSLSDDQLPVFVSILKREAPVGPELEAEVVALAAVVSRIVGRPTDCVHIEYMPGAVGRVAFGGKLVQ